MSDLIVSDKVYSEDMLFLSVLDRLSILGLVS